MRHRFLAALLVLVIVAFGAVAVPAPAGAAQPDPDDTTVTEPEPAPGDDIIPRPNSGAEPTEPGDRGGALQVAVFVGILVTVGVIVALALRDVRRARGRPDAPSR
ncbi:MAG TPA: hypothetical protein VFB77_00565 [Acidimicrobiales bacterium]|nr:hypothetical protein [Acidimicrobiales bacterium]